MPDSAAVCAMKSECCHDDTTDHSEKVFLLASFRGYIKPLADHNYGLRLLQEYVTSHPDSDSRVGGRAIQYCASDIAPEIQQRKWVVPWPGDRKLTCGCGSVGLRWQRSQLV